jgi:hypothetical protein
MGEGYPAPAGAPVDPSGGRPRCLTGTVSRLGAHGGRADTTRRWDRTVKRPLCAAAGIVELWIVDVVARVVEVSTDPGPEGYRTIREVAQGETVSAVALPDLIVAVADILG